MAQSSYTTLAAYFETGDRPTASNFADLIETAVVGPAYSNQVTITTATTLTAAAHAWRTVVVTGTTTVTLPGIAAYTSFYIVNGNDDGVAITIDTNASDKWLLGTDNAASSNGDHMVNTAGTAIKGDFIHLTYASADGWQILQAAGTWAME